MSANVMEAELVSLTCLYDLLEQQLQEEYERLQSEGSLEQVDLDRAATLVARMSEADGRVARFADEWPRYRQQLSSADRIHIQVLASKLERQAQLLLAQVVRNEKLLGKWKDGALASFRQMRTGAQFLHSVRTQQEIQPRFLDLVR